MSRVMVALVLATGCFAQDVNNNTDRSAYKKSLSIDCVNSYSLACFKWDIVAWLDRLNEKVSINVLPGVSIVKEDGAKMNTAEVVSDLAREFPNDPNSRLDVFLLKKVQDYLSSHTLRLNLFNADEAGTARKGGGGGGKKGGGGYGALLAAAAMMKGTLMALALGALAALAGKALMTSLISLLLSALLGMKHMGGGGKHEEHYVHAGHRRNLDLPMPLGLHPEYNNSIE